MVSRLASINRGLGRIAVGQFRAAAGSSRETDSGSDDVHVAEKHSWAEGAKLTRHWMWKCDPWGDHRETLRTKPHFGVPKYELRVGAPYSRCGGSVVILECRADSSYSTVAVHCE